MSNGDEYHESEGEHMKGHALHELQNVVYHTTLPGQEVQEDERLISAIKAVAYAMLAVQAELRDWRMGVQS